MKAVSSLSTLLARNRVTKILVAVYLALILASASRALSEEAADDQSNEIATYTPTESKIPFMVWNASNKDALLALDPAAIKEFSDKLEDNQDEEFGDFAWIDLAGDGRYELLVTRQTRAYSVLYLYWQEAPGRMRTQSYAGPDVDPHNNFKDLNGNGKQELILEAGINPESSGWFDLTSLAPPEASWPEVYRLEGERYIAASREFPKYYDTDVLPQVEKEIRKARQRVAAQQGKPEPTPAPNVPKELVDYKWLLPGRELAVAIMERDKILRVLGRDPNAGLADAREWLKSSDPELVNDAVIVLTDIGGHDKELDAAESALGRR